jgi:hypothetical protein
MNEFCNMTRLYDVHNNVMNVLLLLHSYFIVTSLGVCLYSVHCAENIISADTDISQQIESHSFGDHLISGSVSVTRSSVIEASSLYDSCVSMSDQPALCIPDIMLGPKFVPPKMIWTLISVLKYVCILSFILLRNIWDDAMWRDRDRLYRLGPTE